MIKVIWQGIIILSMLLAWHLAGNSESVNQSVPAVAKLIH